MKQLLKIILPIMGKKGVLKYALLGIVTGASSFLFVNMVTRVVGVIVSGKYTSVSKEYLIIFSAIILIFIWARRTLVLTSANFCYRMVWDLRKTVVTLVLNTNYRQLSDNRAKVQTALIQDVTTLANASLMIIDFGVSLIMVVSCFVYLACISVTLFAITLAVSVLAVAIYYAFSKRNIHGVQMARSLDNAFQGHFNSILNGFKEIFIAPAKGRFIFEKRVSVIAEESYEHSISANTGWINNQITGQIFFYLLITSVLLIFGVVLKMKAADVVAFVFTLMFLLGSISALASLFPVIMQAKVASDHLMSIKQELADGHFNNPVPKGIFNRQFTEIVISDLRFRYQQVYEGESFGIGPIDLTIKRGDTIFIYGGNGSGKTTFINNVTGLCHPSSGAIRVNETVINEDNYSEYRNLFAVVFSDFHLFGEILTDEEIDLEKWEYYLNLFELQGKVTLEQKRFSTIALSAGQKKRLALMVALLENRPVLVLDEWAADQDPHFRKKFYTEIIPLLNKNGYTIIAITHDDKYYHCAGKLYKFNDGKMIDENKSLRNTDLAWQESN